MPGGQAILTLCALIQSGRFDSAWELLSGTYRREVNIPDNMVPFRRLTSPPDPVTLIVVIERPDEPEGIPYHVKDGPQQLLWLFIAIWNYDFRQNNHILLECPYISWPPHASFNG